MKSWSVVSDIMTTEKRLQIVIQSRELRHEKIVRR
jgi:hypothetical protein